jgi:glycosyltransferase involved in cell wall biosynthesis
MVPLGESRLSASVVTAIRGGWPFVPEMLRSLAAQTHPVDEVVLVDDGIDELSRATIDQQCDLPIRVVPSKGQGLAAALNTGLRSSVCDVIVRLDADDVALPNRVSLQLKHLEVNPDVVMVGGQIQRITETGQRLGISNLPLNHDDILRSLRRRQHAICHSSVAFRRAAALSVDGYWDEGVAEDWDFYLRMATKGRVENLPDTLIEYRYHGNSINANQLLAVRRHIAYSIELDTRQQRLQPPISYDQFLRDRSSLRLGNDRREALGLGWYRNALNAGGRPSRLLGLSAATCVLPDFFFRRIVTQLQHSASRRAL